MQQSSCRSRIKATAIALACLLTLLCIVPLIVNDFFSCAICGKSRSVARIFGVSIRASEFETDCSRWYRNHVESSHRHVWVQGTWRETIGVFGFPSIGTNFSSRASGPLVRFNSKTRLMIYQQSSSIDETRELFLKLAYWESDPIKRTEQSQLEQKLAEWVDNIFSQ